MNRNTKITLAVLATLAIGASAAYAFGPGKNFHNAHASGMGFSYGGGHGGGHGFGHGRGRGKGRMIFKKLDTDKDGVITRKEAETFRDTRFTKMDTDSDGTITSAEIDSVIEKRLNRMKVRMRYRMLSKLDRNGDGQVSKEEFSKKPMRLFDMADANGDDKVTRQEARQLRKRGRGFMRHMRKGWRRGFENHNEQGESEKGNTSSN